MKSHKHKISLRWPATELAELRVEAERQDRSQSWVAQKAWTLAKERLKAMVPR